MDKEFTNIIKQAREECGCYSCCGLRALGAHTIAGNAPRSTPSSCVAGVLLEYLLRKIGP